MPSEHQNQHSYPRLVVDLGGTNIRLAIAEAPAKLGQLQTFSLKDFASMQAVVDAYLADVDVQPLAACIAIAGPVLGDELALVNYPWRFSLRALAERYQWLHVRALNDFAAIAYSIAVIEADELLAIGGDSAAAVAGKTCTVLGPGTGLGVAQYLPSEGSQSAGVVQPAEGGFVGIAPATEREQALFAYYLAAGECLHRELFLSGPGLLRIYAGLCAIDGEPQAFDSPAAVSDAALANADGLAREALSIFCALLGSAAADQALACGAQGGVYLAGGILPRIQDFLQQSDFRARFEAKGKMRAYLERIPSQLILAQQPGLLGASAAPLQ